MKKKMIERTMNLIKFTNSNAKGKEFINKIYDIKIFNEKVCIVSEFYDYSLREKYDASHNQHRPDEGTRKKLEYFL